MEMLGEKKDLKLELEKVKNMVKTKLNRDNGFPPFVITYSLVNGNKMVQVEKWESAEERYHNFKQVTDWAKSEQPYGIIFGSIATAVKYETDEDQEKKVNGKTSSEILLILKTPESSVHVCIGFGGKEGEYTFVEETFDETNHAGSSLVDDVFVGLN